MCAAVVATSIRGAGLRFCTRFYVPPPRLPLHTDIVGIETRHKDTCIYYGWFYHYPVQAASRYSLACVCNSPHPAWISSMSPCRLLLLHTAVCRVDVSAFRGTVQASTTRQSSFRVLWRGDAFTTPQDAPNSTMLSEEGWSSSRSRGGRRQLQPAPVLSQDDELAVSREAACALAAWAKSEFPSVTLTETYGLPATTIAGDRAKGGGAAATHAGSLGGVRKGVETVVRACVLEVSEVERLWLWESAGGM